MISPARLADVVVTLSDTLVSDFDLVDFFGTLTDQAQEISEADTVGLVLADATGALQFMAASSDAGRFLELFQLQETEGPCRDAYRSGVAVVNRDLGSAEGVWPTFAPAARAAGFQSVHAFPMRLRGETIGALNLFARARRLFSAREVRIVQALADVATIAILQQRSAAQAELVATQLQHALNSRVVIEQAKGFLARRLDVSVDDAYDVLRDRARTEGRPLLEVAADLLVDRPAPPRRVPSAKPGPPRTR